MEDETFRNLVKEALFLIPQEFLDKMENVSVVVEDYPTPYQLQKLNLRGDSLLLGLYEGVPQTRRGNYTGVLPDKITIFRRPIELVARSPEDIKRIVRNTVIHEVAHHFGMDETQVRQAEAERQKRASEG